MPLYRVVAEDGSGRRVSLVIRAERRGGHVSVEVLRVEEGTQQMAHMLKMLIEAMSRGRSSWLYRGTRGAGRRIREQVQAGPRRVLVESLYDRHGWLVEGSAQLAGFRARIERLPDQEQEGEGRA